MQHAQDDAQPIRQGWCRRPATALLRLRAEEGAVRLSFRREDGTGDAHETVATHGANFYGVHAHGPGTPALDARPTPDGAGVRGPTRGDGRGRHRGGQVSPRPLTGPPRCCAHLIDASPAISRFRCDFLPARTRHPPGARDGSGRWGTGSSTVSAGGDPAGCPGRRIGTGHRQEVRDRCRTARVSGGCWRPRRLDQRTTRCRGRCGIV